MNAPSQDKTGFGFSGDHLTPEEQERRAHANIEGMLRELHAAQKSLKHDLNPIHLIRRYPKKALLFGGGAFVLWRLLRSRRPRVANVETSGSGGGLMRAVVLRAAQAAGKALPGAIMMGLARHGLNRMRGRARE